MHTHTGKDSTENSDSLQKHSYDLMSEERQNRNVVLINSHLPTLYLQIALFQL